MQTALEQFSETQSTEAFALQNSKLLKVRLDQGTIQAKLGAMVAYQGEVSFEHAGSAPTFADAQAAITWSGDVTTSIRTDFKAIKNLTGRGSGETVQMAFGGSGWVLVQPSEGRVEAAGGGGGGGNGAGGVLGNL